MVIWENLISFEFPYHYIKPQSNLAICHKLEGFYQIPFSLTFLSLSYKGIKINKEFHSFIDLWLHFDLCENESYSIFVAKGGFFSHTKIYLKCVIKCSLILTH